MNERYVTGIFMVRVPALRFSEGPEGLEKSFTHKDNQLCELHWFWLLFIFEVALHPSGLWCIVSYPSFLFCDSSSLACSPLNKSIITSNIPLSYSPFPFFIPTT